MSQCRVPSWNLRYQRQERVGGEESNRSSHVHDQLLQHPIVPMSNYEVAELTWENGQLAMHGLSGLLHSNPTKPVWGRTNETLESIVHQATNHKQNKTSLQEQEDHQTTANISTSNVASSDGKWATRSSGHHVHVGPMLIKKRSRLDNSNQYFAGNYNSQDEHVDRSACAIAANATFCRDSDTTMMTWASYESPRSMKTKTTDEDSACHGGSENQDEDRETKTETVRSQSSKRSRAAAVHNQSERRRRDRINQKMKALQKLVPNASKTDKASMLDEVIEYLKQLQAQVQLMSIRNMPQMMMPIGMQQQLQMSLLARMGMGVGLGMGMSAPQSLSSLMHPTAVAAAAANSPFVPHPFVVPPIIPSHGQGPGANPDCGTNSTVPLPDPYCAFLAQSMNMELYNKIAALYEQQVNQSMKATSSPSESNHVQGD